MSFQNNFEIDEAELRDLLNDEGTSEEQVADYFQFDEETLPEGQEKGLLGFEDIPNLSTADVGLLGLFNRCAQRTRQRKFLKKLKEGFKGITIVAEGDSWFHHPGKPRDVIQHLMEVDDFNVYTLAHAGDWLSNMVAKQDQLLSAVETYQPTVVLLSGGGNDLVGKRRLRTILKEFERCAEPSWYLGAGFELALYQILSLYEHLFNTFRERFPLVQIVCHGYDYAIPKSGRWLGDPMASIGIKEREVQRLIIRELIQRFSDALEKLADGYERVTFIPCAGHVTDWHDELHPETHSFGKIADEFGMAILASG